MDIKQLIALFMLMGIVSLASAAPEDMTVTAWDPGCEHTMTTNHFELAPGESVEIDLDMTGCYQEQLGGLMYFGYYTTKKSSRPLVERNNVRLILVDGEGNEIISDSGSIYTEPSAPVMCKLYAQNMNHRKTVKIRLRAKAGL